jgi:ATP-dependent Clp protease ATP-binding subunit ClpA
MVSDEIRGVLELQKRLEERVIGQSHALAVIAEGYPLAIHIPTEIGTTR